MSKQLNKEAIYKRWSLELEHTQALPYAHQDKYRNLILILQTNEMLFTQIIGKKVTRANQLQKISRLIMAHSYQLGAASFHLTKAGFGSQALVLTRSLLESLIDLTYLWLCKDIHGDIFERNAWLEYYKVTRYSVLDYSKKYRDSKTSSDIEVEYPYNEYMENKIMTDFSNYKTDYPHTTKNRYNNWPKSDYNSLIKRAKAIDKTGKLQKGFPVKNVTGFPKFSFEAEYIVIYKHTSEYVHGEISAIKTLLEETEARRIIIGPGDTNVEVANGLVTNYLLVLSYIFAHINNLSINFIMEELHSHGFIKPQE